MIKPQKESEKIQSHIWRLIKVFSHDTTPTTVTNFICGATLKNKSESNLHFALLLRLIAKVLTVHVVHWWIIADPQQTAGKNFCVNCQLFIGQCTK